VVLEIGGEKRDKGRQENPSFEGYLSFQENVDGEGSKTGKKVLINTRLI